MKAIIHVFFINTYSVFVSINYVWSFSDVPFELVFFNVPEVPSRTSPWVRRSSPGTCPGSGAPPPAANREYIKQNVKNITNKITQ